MKGEGESFSDVIEKLLQKKRNVDIKKYFGVLKNSEVLDEIERYIEKRRLEKFRI